MNDLELLLNKNDYALIKKIKSDAESSYEKQQFLRTETEMRLSVLNDGKHPTRASKYWQCVREQSVMYENLMELNFQYRKALVHLKKMKQITQFNNEFDLEIHKINIEEAEWNISKIKKDAHHRVREIEHWYRIKQELNDGSFDDQDPNTHQFDTLKLKFEHETRSISNSTPASEIKNIIGHQMTINRMIKDNKSIVNEEKKQINE